LVVTARRLADGEETLDWFEEQRLHPNSVYCDEQTADGKDTQLMLRTLRILAAISFIWMVGSFLLAVTEGARYPFTSSRATYFLVASLCGELVFTVGILALVATASRRRVGWFALFALLVTLLHVLPQVIFQPPVSFLALFEFPPELAGQYAWVFLLPALIPGMAFVYTLIARNNHHAVAKETRPSPTT
jgi:hypothetical protein